MLAAFKSLIMGLFIYVGARFLLPNVITGTSQAEQIILTAVPITLACVTIAVVVGVFRG
jgi:hypothetical protein